MRRSKSMSRIFVGYVPGKAQDTEFQCKAMALIAYIATPTAAIFSIVNYLSGHIWLAAVELFTVCLLIPCFRLMRNPESLHMLRNILMANAFMVFTAVFIDGGVADSGIIWSLVVPFLAFLLMGLPVAWYWVISYALVNAVVIGLHFSGHLSLPYNDSFLAYFPAVFIFFALIAAVFEVQLERLHHSHEETIDELETLRNNLEAHVDRKTSELTQANEQLQSEVEQHENTARALKESEALLLHAQKMEAIGTLVGGIAHDFNNMLAGITGNLYLLKTKLKDQPDLSSKVAIIDQLCFKAAKMIAQLLAFARKDHVNLQSLSLTAFMQEALQLSLVSIPESIRVKQDVCTDELVVLGDITQLQQVVLNVINNARDALEGVASPEITARLTTFTPDVAFRKKYKSRKLAEQYAHLSVQDNGSGISDADQQRIFEPFFTTKEQGKGTGLGLAMVFGAIHTHDGIIAVDSEPGHGSTFHIYLPLQQQDCIDFDLPPTQAISSGHGETILFADDEPQVRETIGEVLENIGYRVLLAADGAEAVSLYSKHQDQVALSILDVVMPEMGGRQAAAQILRHNPSALILFATGYDRLSATEKDDGIPASQSIGKPFAVASLSKKIRQLLTP